MKYCKNCRYAETRVSITGDIVYYKCMHPKTMSQDPVYGPSPHYCSVAREVYCGNEEARYYEERVSFWRRARKM